MNANKVTCPECDGRGEVMCRYYELDEQRPGTPRPIKCGLCDGAMVVTSSQCEEYWIEFWEDSLKEALYTSCLPEEFDEVKERIFQEIRRYFPALEARLKMEEIAV